MLRNYTALGFEGKLWRSQLFLGVVAGIAAMWFLNQDFGILCYSLQENDCGREKCGWKPFPEEGLQVLMNGLLVVKS